MKTGRYIKFVVVIAFILSIAGCANKSDQLVKTWMVQNLKYSRVIPPDMQPQIDRAVEEIRQTFRLTYRADGTYETKNGQEVLTGTWKLNFNSTKITSYSAKGDEKSYDIIELSADKFNFKAIEGGEEVIFEMIPAK